MTEFTPTTVPGHAALRAQAAELRLPGLLAHWDELMGQPETEQRVRQWLGWEGAARADRSLQRRARWIVNQVTRAAARRRPVVDWGLKQAMHVFGCATPFDPFEATRAFRTGDISRRVNQDVLLLAGDADHHVPLGQLWHQARMLTAARSITCRVFTRVEGAQAHCQVGNLPLAIAVMTGWLETLRAA